MNEIIKKIVPNKILGALQASKNKDIDIDIYSTRSYSQEGEDMILNRMLGAQQSGFYVDVGAHHPFRFSNTYFFYKKGWRGINIDAMPGSMKLFNQFRSEDINLELPISDTKEMLNYYMFNDPALNGFSKELSELRHKQNDNFFIEKEVPLQTHTLAGVLDTHLKKDTIIDFLNVDVEGLDFQVLRSNNWLKYKPKIIMVEIAGNGLFDVRNSDTCFLLEHNGYVVYSKTVSTVFFVRKDLLGNE
jgi:FkbM family methyltransferase